MAVFRQVQVTFWQDAFVIDRTPEEKYFYLYLMTNSKTTQCGIYELPLRIIEIETGYNQETVTRLLERFIEYGKIKYDWDTQEIMLTNWVKHNKIRGPKVLACVQKELKEVKNKEFIKLFIKLCKDHGYPIDTLSIDYEEEKEKEEEKEINNTVSSYKVPKEEQKTDNQTQQIEEKQQQTQQFNDPFQFYEANGFGTLPPLIAESIQAWIHDYNGREEIVTAAMMIAVKNNVRKWSYVEGILKDWFNKGYRTLEDIKAGERRREIDRIGPAPKHIKRDRLPVWIQDQDKKDKPLQPTDPEEERKKRERVKQLLISLGEWDGDGQDGQAV